MDFHICIHIQRGPRSGRIYWCILPTFIFVFQDGHITMSILYDIVPLPMQLRPPSFPYLILITTVFLVFKFKIYSSLLLVEIIWSRICLLMFIKLTPGYGELRTEFK